MTEDEEEDGDFAEDDSDDKGPEDTPNLPAWLSVLLGLVSSGGLAGSFRVPWKVARKHILKILIYRRMR